VVGNETVAEDTLADGEKKAVAVAEVELADVEEAPAEDAGARCSLRLGFLFLFFSSTCLPTIRAETSSPDAAACAISSCLPIDGV